MAKEEYECFICGCTEFEVDERKDTATVICSKCGMSVTAPTKERAFDVYKHNEEEEE